MALDGVCGSSEEARALKDMLNKTMQMIDAAVGGMESAVKQVKSGWNDEGVQEVEEIMAAIKSALASAQEASPKVEKSLEAYAEHLDQM